MSDQGAPLYEGKVVVDYQKFLDGLDKMDKAVRETGNRIATVLNEIEAGFKNLSIGSIATAFATQMSTMGKESQAAAAAVKKSNDLIAESQTKLGQSVRSGLGDMGNAQRAWSTEIGKTSATAATSFDAIAERYQRMLKTVTAGEAPDVARALGIDLATLDVKINAATNKLKELKASVAANPKDTTLVASLAEAARLRAELIAERQQVELASDALIGQQKATVAQQIELEAKGLRAREAEHKQFLDKQVALVKSSRGLEAQAVEASLQKQISQMRQAAATQLQIQQEQAAQAAKLKARLEVGGMQSAERAGVKQAYDEAVAAARKAKLEEESLQRALTNTIEAERRAQGTAAKEQAAIAKEAAKVAAETGTGFWGHIGNAARKAGKEIKEVENNYNSLFRGGSQIASVGTQLTMLGGQIRTVAQDLIAGAGDFDFWVRRAEAAAISAGSVWEDKTQSLNEALQQAVFDLGDEVGSAEFAQLAEGLYVYQSAAGGAIDNVTDLRIAQEGLTEVYKAATITGDDYSKTTRGVLQVLAEFGLGVEDMDRVTRILMNASQVTQTEFGDMVEAFKYLGPTFKEMGGSIEEAAALLAKLSDYGLKGSNAGRGLQMAIEAIASPTEATAAALQDLLGGLRGVDSSWREVLQPKGDLLTFLDQVNADGTVTKGVISELANAMKGMSEAQKFESLNAIFAQNNAARQMVPLIADQINEINKASGAQKVMTSSVGDTVALYERMVKTGTDAKTQIEVMARATKDMTNENRQSVFDQILKIDPATGKQTVDSILATIELLKTQALEAERSKMTVDELYASFKDGGEQARLFNKQWEIIGDSVKVKMGRAVGDIKESMIKIGLAVAEVALPVVQKIGEIIKRFMTWAEANEETAKGLLKFIAVIGGLATVLGPLLVLLGGVVQGVAAIPVILQAVKSGFGAFISILTPFGGGLIAAAAALALIAGAVILVRRNWAGLGDAFAEFSNGAGLGLKTTLEGITKLLLGLATFDSSLIKDALGEVGQGLALLAVKLVELVGGVAGGIGDKLISTITGWLRNAGVSLITSFRNWGYNLVASLAQGMIDFANGQLEGILAGIANNIARFFRSFSPPKYGPLMGIYTWGKNLIQTFAEGMKAADIKDAEAAAQMIVDAISDSFKAGMSSGDWLSGAQLANEAVMKMMATVRDGGRVGEEFFDSLAPYLGRWKDEITDVLMAYQEVYALERQIKLEEQKLEIIKAQRQELDKQLEIKNDLFDQKVDPTGPAYYQAYKDEMVDPTTAEGQARIKMMKESLSKEDFQSWIAFQKKLWESKHKEEDFALKAQEDAAEALVAGYKAQLAVVAEQYDYYKAIYEYALKLANLGETDPTKKTGGGGGGGGGSSQDDDADMADLEAARRRMREIAGEDQAIKDENRLAEERGGPIGGIGGADEQRDREAERIKDLDAANRKQKAEFDARKIAAKGNEEELTRIKREEEAWNTAYQEEKARLGERKRDTEDILEAGQELADITAPERIDAKKAEYAEQIKQSVGEQTASIETAEQIKARTGDLDKAAIDSQKQLRQEERELADLRDLNQEKQLDFEERLKDAAGDEEKIRKIKEEQDAWELAYKAALKLQEERTDAARRADQDINDQQQGERQAGGGGFDEGFAGGPALGGGGGINMPDLKTDSDGDRIPDYYDPTPNGDDQEPSEPQPYGPPVPPGYVAPQRPMTPAEQALTGNQGTGYDYTTGEVIGKDYGAIAGSNGELAADLVRGWDRLMVEGLDAFDKYWQSGVDDMLGRNIPATGDSSGAWQNNEQAGKDWVVAFLKGVEQQTGVSKDFDSVAQGLMSNLGKAFEGIEAPNFNIEEAGKALDGLGAKYGDKFVAELLGPNGPYATSDYTLGEVNGVWQKVLRDSDGNPTKISQGVLDSVNSAFYDAFTGDKNPSTTTDEMLKKVGSSFYVRLTGEGSPPASVAEMVDKVGEAAYKLVTGEESVPKTMDEMVKEVGGSMYKLLTGEDAPAKTSDEFVSNMGTIFKKLGIDGPIPTDVQAGIDLIGRKILEDLSPDGKVPSTVEEGIDAIGNDFLKKFSPNGELPKTVTEAMTILGTAVSGGMKGEGGLTWIAQTAVDETTGSFKTLLDSKDGPVQTSQLVAERVKTSYYDLSTDGPAQTTDTMLQKVAGFYTALDSDGPTGLPGIVKATADKIRAMHTAEKDGEGGTASLWKGLLDKVRGAVAQEKDGEGGILNLFTGMANQMATTAQTKFGAVGEIATSFGDLAASMARAVLGIPKPPSGSTGSSGGAEQKNPVASNYAGTDDTGGDPNRPQLRTLHGREAVLSHSNNDATTFRALKKDGIWESLKGAIFSRQALRGVVERVSSPAATLPAEPLRSILPVSSGGVGKHFPIVNNNQTNNITFVRSNKDQENRFLKKVGEHFS